MAWTVTTASIGSLRWALSVSTAVASRPDRKASSRPDSGVPAAPPTTRSPRRVPSRAPPGGSSTSCAFRSCQTIRPAGSIPRISARTEVEEVEETSAVTFAHYPGSPRQFRPSLKFVCLLNWPRWAQPRQSLPPPPRGVTAGPPGALLPVAAAWRWTPLGALGRTRRLRAVGRLVGPAQRRQVVGHRLVGLFVVAGYLLACGDSPGDDPLAIERWPWTVPVRLQAGRRPGLRLRRLARLRWHLGTMAGRHGVAEPGHDGGLARGHRLVSRPGGSPARAGGSRGLPAAAAPVSDHDQGSHHDQRGAQRNASQQQSGHGQPPRVSGPTWSRTLPAPPVPLWRDPARAARPDVAGRRPVSCCAVLSVVAHDVVDEAVFGGQYR